MVKKIGKYGAIAFLIWFIAFRPDAAAKAGRSLVSNLHEMAVGVGTFLSGVIG